MYSEFSVSEGSSISPVIAVNPICSFLGVLLNFICTAQMFSLFGMIAHIILVVIGYQFQFSVLSDTRKRTSLSCKVFLIRSLAFPIPSYIHFKTEVCLIDF